MADRVVIGSTACDHCGASVEVYRNRYGRGYYKCVACDQFVTFSKVRADEIEAAASAAPQLEPELVPVPEPQPEPEPKSDGNDNRNPWSILNV